MWKQLNAHCSARQSSPTFPAPSKALCSNVGPEPDPATPEILGNQYEHVAARKQYPGVNDRSFSDKILGRIRHVDTCSESLVFPAMWI